jgi:acetate---CoA ligase (ADP-forming)
MDRAVQPPVNLSRLLRPRSIAVVGGRPAAEVIRQCRRMGFDGEIWPVHRRLEEVEGLKVYRSAADLPEAPDAAFIAVNRDLTIETMAALAARGAGGAVAYASGFAELGQRGAALQAKLIAAAGAMPFLGPNCYGFINYFDGVLLWPDQHGGERIARGVAIITQSGNIGLNLTMQRRALPLGYLVTLGNQATVGLSRAIEAALDDTRVTAIGLHIEGIDDAVAFANAAARARRQGVPLVALKVGRSRAGAVLAVSHTASVVGQNSAVSDFLERVGAVRVHSLPALVETLKLLHVLGPLPGRDIASLSCSGGEAALIADAAEGKKVRFRALDAAQSAQVAGTLPELVTVSNPLDYHTFHWGDEAALTGTFAAMMAANYDMTVLILDFPRTDRCDDASWDVAVRALAAASRVTGKRAGVVATLAEAMPESRAKALLQAGIVPLSGIDDALSAIEAAATVGELAKRSHPGTLNAPSSASRKEAALTAAGPIFAPAAAGGIARTLTEWDGKRALAAYGLNLPEGRVVATAEEAASAAASLGFPVVLKALGADIAHKTEMGAVKLDLRDATAVAGAASAMRGFGDALLVERMVSGVVAELLVGVGREPGLGFHLVLGSGGVLVELVGDTKLLMMPATREEIVEAIASLRVAKLLDGYRGRPKGDLEAAVAAVLAVQGFAVDNARRLVELEVNPLIVRAAGSGAVAVDVLVRFLEEESRG